MISSTGISRSASPARRARAVVIRAAAVRTGGGGRPAGFTVIELLLVMLIIGTMAGLSAPRLRSGYERLRLNEAASSIGRTIRMAREAAITEGTVYRIQFDGDRRSYRVERMAVEGSTYEAPGRRWAGPSTLPDGIEMSVVPLGLGFSPNGRAFLVDGTAGDRAGPDDTWSGAVEETAELVLTDGAGESVALMVDMVTGGVRMEAGGR